MFFIKKFLLILAASLLLLALCGCANTEDSQSGPTQNPSQNPSQSTSGPDVFNPDDSSFSSDNENYGSYLPEWD